MVNLTKEFTIAAKVISESKAMVITAGAGMGVDSGLPDFRGPEGFWKAYPPLKGKGIQLSGMSNPAWFEDDPKFAWGFFGHRYNLYKKANPHQGFQILKKWVKNKELGYFVYTSNVDGHFQKAGFDPDRILECHGSINYLQCVDENISKEIWPVPEDFNISVDEDTLHATSPLPKGPPFSNDCLARPNILMFDDWGFIGDRTNDQHSKYLSFQSANSVLKNDPRFVVIEIGAGLSVPSVRMESESLARQKKGATLIRINPREPQVPEGHISLPLPGLEALNKLDDLVQSDPGPMRGGCSRCAAPGP